MTFRCGTNFLYVISKDFKIKAGVYLKCDCFFLFLFKKTKSFDLLISLHHINKKEKQSHFSKKLKISLP